MSHSKKFAQKAGLVLTEALVAVATLGMAVLALGTITTNSISTTIISKDYLVARGLLDEADEAVLNINYTNWLLKPAPADKLKCWLRLVPDNIVDSLCNSNVSAGSSYIAFLSGGIWRMTLEGNTDLNLDTSPTITNNKFLMYVDGSGYSYIKNAGAVASKFYRGIKFTNIAADNSQATYTVSVQWKDGAKTRTLDKTITLYNYL